MTAPSSHKSSTKRRFLSWLLALLTIVLLVGFGSDLHGQDCTCEKSPVEICEMCEIQHLDAVMVAPVMDVHSQPLEAPTYVRLPSGRLLITDLETDHPPPEQGRKG